MTTMAYKLWLYGALGAGLAGAQMQTGGMTATVVDAKGKPVAGLYVSATPLGTKGGTTRTEVSGKGGEVDFGRMRAGFYRLCLSQPGSTYLDPCVWSKPEEVAVWPDKTAAVRLTVESGSMLRVRVEDSGPKKFLDDAAVAQRMELKLGLVMENGRIHPFPTVTRDANGRSYETAIPFDRPLQMAVYSGGLQMADGKGAPVGSGQSEGGGERPAMVPVRHGSGQSNPDIRFTVTGAK